jgi:hypothetical protein
MNVTRQRDVHTESIGKRALGHARRREERHGVGSSRPSRISGAQLISALWAMVVMDEVHPPHHRLRRAARHGRWSPKNYFVCLRHRNGYIWNIEIDFAKNSTHSAMPAPAVLQADGYAYEELAVFALLKSGLPIGHERFTEKRNPSSI